MSAAGAPYIIRSKVLPNGFTHGAACLTRAVPDGGYAELQGMYPGRHILPVRSYGGVDLQTGAALPGVYVTYEVAPEG